VGLRHPGKPALLGAVRFWQRAAASFRLTTRVWVATALPGTRTRPLRRFAPGNPDRRRTRAKTDSELGAVQDSSARLAAAACSPSAPHVLCHAGGRIVGGAAQRPIDMLLPTQRSATRRLVLPASAGTCAPQPRRDGCGWPSVGV
jgi:hypothetical protein